MLGIDISRSMNDNLTRVYLGQYITVWFSYEAPIAFAINGEGTFKQVKGLHSRTTDRHLNSIAATELSAEDFEARLGRLLETLDAALENSDSIESKVL